MTARESGEAVSDSLAGLTREVLGAAAVGGGSVGEGGETSCALCRRLKLAAPRVGRNTEPGVPACFSLGEFRPPVVLRSGSFGGQDFYGKAPEALRSSRALDRP